MKKITDYIPKTNAAPLDMTLIMPYLSPEQQKLIADYERWNNQPAFVLALERHKESCPNCGGGGIVYVRYCDGGPYVSPTQGKPVTYFDGDGRRGKGWYTIKETKGYPCQECVKNGRIRNSN